MKIGIFARSTVGYLIVLFLLGTSNVYAIFKLVQFNTFIIKGQNVEMRLLDVEKKLEDSVFSQRRYEQKYMITRDDSLFKQFLAEKNDFDRYLKEVGATPLSPYKKDSYGKIQKYEERYDALVDSEVKYLTGGTKYDAEAYRLEKEKVSDAILTELQKLEKYSHEDADYKTKMVRDAGISARRVAVLSFMITILVAILLSFLMTRSITNPLIKLVHKTREIPTGLFKCDLNVATPPEIRELGEAFNLMCLRIREVDRIKSDFFSMISHELKTPLTTIREGSTLLLEGAGGVTTDKQNRLLRIIGEESKRLIGLVNSILDLSKMEAGMVTYNLELGSIAPLIDQAIHEIMPYAEAKKIHLQKEIQGEIPFCRMDGERILEVLRNLIGNAVKFTPEEGSVTVAAHGMNGDLEVSVSDTGPGIPKENMATIFEKYESSDMKKGTGLGLAIVKHITTAHGGRVWAESRIGQGSRFVFVLPS